MFLISLHGNPIFGVSLEEFKEEDVSIKQWSWHSIRTARTFKYMLVQNQESKSMTSWNTNPRGQSVIPNVAERKEKPAEVNDWDFTVCVSPAWQVWTPYKK